MLRRPLNIGASGITGITFVSVTPSATVAFGTTPAFTFVASGQTLVPSPTPAYVALFDPTTTGGWTTLVGPVTIGGTSTTWSFPAGAFSTTFRAGSTYVFALFTATSAVPTPTPAPTPSPSPTPTPTPTPGPTLQAAPAIGLLAALQGGGFGGKTTTTSTSATLVGIAGGLQSSNAQAVATVGQVSVGVNGVGGNAVRRATQRKAVDTSKLTPEFHSPVTERILRDVLRTVKRRAPGDRTTASLRRTQSLPTAVGSTAMLWAQNSAIGTSSGHYQQVAATLVAVTAHGNIWVDNSLTSVMSSPSTIAAIGNDYENGWASDNAHFANDSYDASIYAPANTCDANGNVTGTGQPYVTHSSSVVVFVINPNSLGGGVGGYFDPTNFFADAFLQCFADERAIGAHSNEAPMVYLGWFGPGGGSSSLIFTLEEDLVRVAPHEYQHLLNYVNHVIRPGGQNAEDPFINEGLSVLAQDLAVPRMFPSLTNDAADAVVRADRFLAAPQDFSLTGFSGVDNPDTSTTPAYNCAVGCYGAAYLFQRYLHDRFGGDTYLANAEAGTSVGLAHLASITGESPASLLDDFGLTLAASGATTDPRYQMSGFAFGTSLATQFGTLQAADTAAAVNSGSPGPGLFSGPYNGGYILVAVPGNGSSVTMREKTGLITLDAGISQH